MSEVVIPPDILPESPETIELVDDQTLVFESQFSRRYTQRNSYGDPRWRFNRRYRGLRAGDQSRMRTMLMEARGAFRTVWLSPAQGVRGSFPATELFIDSNFSQGVANWNVQDGVLTASNNTLRATRTKGGTGVTTVYQLATLPAAYFPYTVRSFVQAPNWPAANPIGPVVTDTLYYGADYQTLRGLRTAFFVAMTTDNTAKYPLYALNGGGGGGSPTAVGTTLDVLFTSMSQCFLVDNGPNRLNFSSDFSNAAWTKTELSVSTGFTGPDNSNAADKLTPTTANTSHFALQSYTISSEANVNYSLTIAVKADGYNFVRLAMGHDNGGIASVFNLNTGVVGTYDTASGTGWAHRRRYMTNMGDGWYQCTIVGIKTNATTRIDAYVIVQDGDNALDFAGNGTSGIQVFRATSALSGMPTRLVDYGASVDADGVEQTGGALHVKGLPLDTAGLLLPGDWVEIGGQLKQVTAALNSDQSGLGYLQFRPGLHRSPADNSPIIVTKPMGRFLLREGASWSNRYGHYADIDLTLDEVYT